MSTSPLEKAVFGKREEMMLRADTAGGVELFLNHCVWIIVFPLNPKNKGNQREPLVKGCSYDIKLVIKWYGILNSIWEKHCRS